MIPRSRVSGQIRKIKRKEEDARRKALGIPEPFEGTGSEALPFEEAWNRWTSWFSSKGWEAYSFQKRAWEASLRGESGLISVPTGSGKTYAALGGPLIRLLMQGRSKDKAGLRLIYLTPVKALARDLRRAIETVLRENDLPFTVDVRTGDTESGERERMRRRLPDLLITTPESLILLSSEKDWESRFQGLGFVIIDEWHELLASKRGSLLELSLARLRGHFPRLQTWALSATLGNLEEAAKIATGTENPTIISAEIEKETEISVIPPRHPGLWFGSAGLRLKEEVAERIDLRESTIVFTNTRTQAELWHEALLRIRPDWEPWMALHHASLEKEERRRVEDGMKSGGIRLVIATSSLDLGVDFPQVKRVIQIGSVKSVARALQRSGRAEHGLGRKSPLHLCPTNLMEILEAPALREALRRRELEVKRPLSKPLDVLIQFFLNCALSGGFRRGEIAAWIRSAPSFRNVSEEEIDWCLAFLVSGGASLQAYPDFHKLEDCGGLFRFASPRLARLHRLNVGTIVSSSGVLVQFLGGKKIGFVDEAFVTKLKPGETFQFSGKNLQLVRIRDMVALVRLSRNRKAAPAVWNGQSLSLSPVLARRLREEIAKPPEHLPEAERRAVAEFLRAQRERSHLPAPDEVLIELWTSPAGRHAFLYLFEGRGTHEGLGHLMAYRLSRKSPRTISVSANDYGLELLAGGSLGDEEEIREALLETESLAREIEESLNFPEMTKRTFREIARVAGLVQHSAPGRTKTTRQVQISSGLLFDVFKNYDPQNLLLREAKRQAMQDQLEIGRLEAALRRVAESRLVFRELASLSPFSFPLSFERTRSQVSSESLAERVERMQRKLFGDLHGS